MNAVGIIDYDTIKATLKLESYRNFTDNLHSRYPNIKYSWKSRDAVLKQGHKNQNDTIKCYSLKEGSLCLYLDIFNGWQLSVTASLPHNLFGSNYNLVDYVDAAHAVDIISEALGVDLNEALLSRVDITVTLDAPYIHENVHRIVKHPKNLTHKLTYENGLLFGTGVKNKGKKIKEVATTALDLNEDYSGMHNRVILWYGKPTLGEEKNLSNETKAVRKLRIETRIFTTTRIRNFLGESTDPYLPVNSLFEEGFYRKAVLYLKNTFEESMFKQNSYKQKTLFSIEKGYQGLLQTAFNNSVMKSSECFLL